jgi:hypothetical protein
VIAVALMRAMMMMSMVVVLMMVGAAALCILAASSSVVLVSQIAISRVVFFTEGGSAALTARVSVVPCQRTTVTTRRATFARGNRNRCVGFQS